MLVRAAALLRERRLRARRPAGTRVRQAVAGGRLGCLRGDRLPRVLRARRDRAGAGSRAAAGTRRAKQDALRATRRGRDRRALELPPRDTRRDDGCRPRRRQCGSTQAGRAVPRERPGAGRGPARRRRPPCRRQPPAGRRRGGRRPGTRPGRPRDRVHGLRRRGARDRPRRRRDPGGAGAREARGGGDGRQELRDRRFRRRPRRGGARHRRLGLRLCGAEVLGGRPGARPRGGGRHPGRTPGRCGARAARRAGGGVRDGRAAR